MKRGSAPPSPRSRGRAPADGTALQAPKKAQSTGSKAHVVRLIGGLWKRSKLPVPDAPGLRPTPDRVRETLFNWLGPLDGWRCLDAFAGTGALGFEAASRGAAEVTLVERDLRLVKGLQTSQQRLKASQIRIEAADALAWMARREAAAFELVFVDPPFDAGLFEKAMSMACRVVVPGGFVYLEANRAFTGAETELGAAVGAFTLYRHGRAGTVHYHLFQRNEPGYTAPIAAAAVDA